MWPRSAILKSIIIKSRFLLSLVTVVKARRVANMNQLQVIREDKQLRILLMQECDILFYDQLKEVEFSQNNEVYSLSPIAFAKDGSGGEYVILEDESIGFIGSEGQVGRVAESLDDLLTSCWFYLRLFLSVTLSKQAFVGKIQSGIYRQSTRKLPVKR